MATNINRQSAPLAGSLSAPRPRGNVGSAVGRGLGSIASALDRFPKVGGDQRGGERGGPGELLYLRSMNQLTEDYGPVDEVTRTAAQYKDNFTTYVDDVHDKIEGVDPIWAERFRADAAKILLPGIARREKLEASDRETEYLAQGDKRVQQEQARYLAHTNALETATSNEDVELHLAARADAYASAIGQFAELRDRIYPEDDDRRTNAVADFAEDLAEQGAIQLGRVYLGASENPIQAIDNLRASQDFILPDQRASQGLTPEQVETQIIAPYVREQNRLAQAAQRLERTRAAEREAADAVEVTDVSLALMGGRMDMDEFQQLGQSGAWSPEVYGQIYENWETFNKVQSQPNTPVHVRQQIQGDLMLQANSAETIDEVAVVREHMVSAVANGSITVAESNPVARELNEAQEIIGANERRAAAGARRMTEGLWREISAAAGVYWVVPGDSTVLQRQLIANAFTDVKAAILGGVPRKAAVSLAGSLIRLVSQEGGRMFHGPAGSIGSMIEEDGRWTGEIHRSNEALHPVVTEWLSPDTIAGLSGMKQADLVQMLPGIPDDLLVRRDDDIDDEATDRAVINAYHAGRFGAPGSETAKSRAINAKMNIVVGLRFANTIRATKVRESADGG